MTIPYELFNYVFGFVPDGIWFFTIFAPAVKNSIINQMLLVYDEELIVAFISILSYTIILIQINTLEALEPYLVRFDEGVVTEQTKLSNKTPAVISKANKARVLYIISIGC
jgi:hypothetical protein